MTHHLKCNGLHIMQVVLIGQRWKIVPAYHPVDFLLCFLLYLRIIDQVNQ